MELETADAELETVGVELKTVGAELETADAELETAGAELETVGIKLETAWHRIGNSGELETVGAELETVATELETVHVILVTAWCRIGNSTVWNWKQWVRNWKQHSTELETNSGCKSLNSLLCFFCKLSTLWSSSLKMQSSCVGSAGNPHCSCKKCGV